MADADEFPKGRIQLFGVEGDRKCFEELEDVELTPEMLASRDEFGELKPIEEDSRGADALPPLAAYSREFERDQSPFSQRRRGTVAAIIPSPERTSIRLDQAVFGAHLRSALASAFAISIRFLITATMATLAGFPAVRRRSYFVLRSGLQRMATNAGI